MPADRSAPTISPSGTSRASSQSSIPGPQLVSRMRDRGDRNADIAFTVSSNTGRENGSMIIW